MSSDWEDIKAKLDERSREDETDEAWRQHREREAEFAEIEREVAHRIAARTPPARPHVPLSKLGQPPSARGNGHDVAAAQRPWWPFPNQGATR